ncbi:MAG: 23S rRNA (pseudouridine(1915)-N(3))-methyltransferase RlmH [Cyanobacteria bacterium J06632_22]
MAGFPKLRIIAVGKVKKSWLQDAIAVYAQRLPEVTVTEIKDSTPDQEAAKVMNLISAHEQLIPLSEDGELYDSPQFAQWISRFDSGKAVFFIGGPVGVSPTLKQTANSMLSLSPLTFPHELARLLLFEQLYRAKTILQGTNYHK